MNFNLLSTKENYKLILERNQSSYRQIFKATSLFGGVQIYNIVISIIRSKVIAILLGPSGIGILGLLTTSLSFIAGLTNFGLGTSAVRDIAAANESGDSVKIAKIIVVLRRLVWITGLLGFLTTLVFSPWLSQLVFGNKFYTNAFLWLSLSLLFNQLTAGQDVLLQGMRQLSYLAKANVIGATVSLLVSLPLYYLYDIDGIVPAIVITSILTMVVAWYFARKIKTQTVLVSTVETIFEGKSMLKMGFMLSLSGLVAVGSSYVIRIFITKNGGVADVGLYSAGFAIINNYVGLVFTAMAADYYPRLAGAINNYFKTNEVINQQAEIAILILGPILCVFLIFINWGIILLYSNKFLPVNAMIQWAALGMYFKAVSWSMAFLLLAKGNSKMFFLNELIANGYLLLFNILGYKYYGLDGMGISFLAGYFLYFMQMYFVTKKKYKFVINPALYKVFSIQFFLGLICFFIIKFTTTPFSYLYGIFIIGFSIVYSFNEMDKRLGIKALIRKFRKQ